MKTKKILLVVTVVILFFKNNSHAQDNLPNLQSFENQQTVKISKGYLPSDNDYWNYNTWYKNHSIVNLIISGENVTHVTNGIKELAKLAAKDVMIGKVIIIGGTTSFQLLAYKNPADEVNINTAYRNHVNMIRKQNLSARIPSISEFNLQNIKYGISYELKTLGRDLQIDDYVSNSNSNVILESLKIENSPTWVVRYHGKNYIYEGVESLSRQFSRNGEFLDGETQSNQVNDVNSIINEF